MQLSKQCTWISLNLTRISNQARRWAEGVFSSSMYVSSNQMCKRFSPKAGHLLFISALKELAVGHFHWAENGGTGRYQVITGRSTPNVQCLGVGHVFFLNLACQILTATCNTPDALLVHTGRVQCTPDSCAESSANLQGHRMWVTGRTLSVRCSPDLNTERVAKRPHTGRS